MQSEQKQAHHDTFPAHIVKETSSYTQLNVWFEIMLTEIEDISKYLRFENFFYCSLH